MAFITEDSMMMCNKTSITGEEMEDTRLPNVVKTFLTAKEDTIFGAPVAPENIENLKKVSRNILDEFSIIAKNESNCLPAPSAKETVRVFLRVKPKTLEESKYRPPPEKKTASTLDSKNGEDTNSTVQSILNEEDSKTGLDEDGFEVVTLESDYQVAVHAPASSATYKNSMNGNGKLTHRYTFTKIFPPETQQSELFDEMVLPRVEDFLHGRNQLMFTYGATCSGKTFTIQGNTEQPGILPKALDVLFNTINNKLLPSSDLIINDSSRGNNVFLKPVGFSGVAVCKPADIEKIESSKQAVVQLGKELCANSNASFFSSSNVSQDSINSHVSDCSLQSLATMFPMLKNRVRDKQIVNSIKDAENSTSIEYSVWISFAEVYNENIYDMLEKIPEVKRKGDKPRRVPLKLAEDKDGAVYVKGLKEIQVNSADEAYQLLMIGRENLHFAATRLNHQSSRSHCIFNIKVVKIPSSNVYKDQPHMARISMLSFCDLAGSERIKKTLNTGDRQKEAGNINTSLLVLGRVIKAIRHNQITKDPRRQQIVPYRDSKLTRLFQSYFTGRGKASMVVNISQSPYLFDESLQVLKFSAIASKVTVEIFKEPDEPQTVKKRPPPRATDVAKVASNRTRFSILMEKKAHEKSLLAGRGSIAWENPALSSTQKIRNTLSGHGEELTLNRIKNYLTVDNHPKDAMVQDETAYVTVNENDETEIQETTVIDQRYDGLLSVIDGLKEQLISEKQKNLLLERKTETLEKEVRSELCDEFNNMMVEIESGWEQRLQEEKDRASELSDWRINKMQEAYMEKRKKRKRSEERDLETESRELGIKKEKICELDSQLEEEKKENKQLNEQIHAMKEVHQKSMEEQVIERQKLTRQSFQMANQHEQFKGYKETISNLESDLKATNEALIVQSAEPKLKELELQLEEYKKNQLVLYQEKNNLTALLDEAGEEYQAKDAELTSLREQLANLKNNLTQSELRISDQDNEVQECRVLLEEANSRVEEKEFLIEEKDVQIMVLEERGTELEEKIGCIKKVHEQQENDRWLSQKATDQQLSGLNDEIEHLKEEKKKIKLHLECEQGASEKNRSAIEKQEEEISRLENEIKSLIQAEKQQREAKEQIEAEEAILRKQVKSLTQNLSEVHILKKKLKEKDSVLETTVTELETARKENSVTEVLKAEFEALRSDKEEKSKETTNLLFKIDKLQADVKNGEYDVKRLKDDKHNLMDHYEKQIKKKDSEMAILRKRFDPNRTYEMLNNATPNKKLEQNEQEINCLKNTIDANTKELDTTVSNYKEIIEGKDKQLNTLRRELTDKSELVKNLASQIDSPSPRGDDLELENEKLKKELDRVNAEHCIIINKQANASEMLIEEYKQQNVTLQNAVEGSSAKTESTAKESDEEDHKKQGNILRTISDTTNDEKSSLESPSASPSPGNCKRKRGRGRARRNNRNNYQCSPVLCDSQNGKYTDGHTDLREKISNKRNLSTNHTGDCQEGNENHDPSSIYLSEHSLEDSIGSSSSYLGEPRQKRPAKSGKIASRKRNLQVPIKKEVNFEESDESVLGQERSIRRSLRERTNNVKGAMAPPSIRKIENTFLSPLIENESTITVTTTTTLSPQKTRGHFITPANKRKKLFTNTPANEVFTPPETVIDKTSPHTIVKWQLRSRRSRRNN